MSATEQPAGPSVAVTTLGCKLNRAESEEIVASLIGRGTRISGLDEADVIVVNSCTVTGEADAKTRKAIRRAVRSARCRAVFVTGCMAALDGAGVGALGENITVIADKARIADAVAEAAGIPPARGTEDASRSAATPAGEPGASAGPAAPLRVGAPFRTRVMVKVQDGCDSECAYCIVRRARGRSRSKPVDRVVAEVEQLTRAEVGEVVLTGVNLGSYRDGTTDLGRLVSRVAQTGVERLRLSSIEPLDLTDDLLETLAETPALCRHVHVPLQSGSTAVLKAMRRDYTAAEYAAVIERAREALPGLAVTTDVIAGLPGERPSDARSTLAFCEEIGFSGMHVFRYSERPGTLASRMPDRVPPEERARRAEALRRAARGMSVRHLASAVGSTADVLVESVGEHDGEAWAEGTTRAYQRVRFACGSVIPGRSVAVRVRRVVGDRLEGDLVRDRINAGEQGRRLGVTTASRNGTEVR